MAFASLFTFALLILFTPVWSPPTGSSFSVPAEALYDYVVVGSGNAGAPVARRFAEAGHLVVLIEAGNLYYDIYFTVALIPDNGGAFMSRDPETNNLLVDGVIVTTPQAASGLASRLLQGFDEVGLSAIDGFTSGGLIGSAYALTTTQANLRKSSKTAYLDPLIGKKLNLIIYESPHAKQILFENGTVAAEVIVDSKGQQYHSPSKSTHAILGWVVCRPGYRTAPSPR
ncbi:hypothetical protein BDW69DRAFT_180506 [Aspergillus filifer]